MRFRQVHLDFHTSEKAPGIGSEFKKEQFQKALIEGHVDSITVFSKCHHGWAYHPSKANRMHPNLKFDLLAAQLEACREINVNAPVYLSAVYKANTGVTFSDQLLKVRMRHAESLLLSQSIPTAKVAGLCGFCDESYFRKQFKKFFGMNVKEYRNIKNGITLYHAKPLRKPDK